MNKMVIFFKMPGVSKEYWFWAVFNQVEIINESNVNFHQTPLGDQKISKLKANWSREK